LILSTTDAAHAIVRNACDPIAEKLSGDPVIIPGQRTRGDLPKHQHFSAILQGDLHSLPDIKWG
jgi:hypothetical protein